jgi:hypothetical protein
MYAQITITAEYDRGELRQALIDQVGVSTVPMLEMLRETTYAEAAEAIEVVIINGERHSLPRQVLDAFVDRWLSKLVIPASVFALTAYRLSGTTAAESAGIGALAALIALVIELGLFVFHAEEWKWKDVS